MLVAGAIVLTGITLAATFVLTRRLWQRRKAHRQVERERALAAAEAASPLSGIRALQESWRAAIEFLRRSSLRKKGDPLYALPWILVIGPKESGKTAVLQHAQLALFADPGLRAEGLPTAHCDWWYTEQAIFLDTAGRYMSPHEEGRDKDEWLTLLDLMVKYRRQEALNAVVLAFPVSALLNDSIETVETQGRTFRRRLDELIRASGVKVPVYLLLTQGDRLPGIPELVRNLSPEGWRQPVGALNEDPQANAVTFSEETITQIETRFKELRLVIARDPAGSGMSAEFLRLPETFAGLRRGLSALILSAFGTTLYQETPFLRGLFFSGGEVFLHDVFSQVIPQDRALALPTHRAMQWRRETQRLSVASWLAAHLLVGGFMTFVFLQNLNALRSADHDLSGVPALHGELVGDILSLNGLDGAIHHMDAHAYPCIQLGLGEALRISHTLKNKFQNDFKERLLTPADFQMGKIIAGLRPTSPIEPFTLYIGHLVRRLSLIREHQQLSPINSSADFAALSVPSLRVNGGEPDHDLKEVFGHLYMDALQWTTDAHTVDAERTVLQTWLKRLLVLKAGDPRWIIAWANAQDSIAPISLHDYWGGAAHGNREPVVPAVFSRKSKTLIDSFLLEIEQTLADPAAYSAVRIPFDRWYRSNTLQAWRQFLAAFPQGAMLLRNRQEWRQVAERMPKEDSPYFSVLKDATEELLPLTDGEQPSWLSDLLRFRDLHALPGQTLGGWIKKRVHGTLTDPAQANQALVLYQRALQKTADTVADHTTMMSAVSQAFADTNAADASVFGAAFTAATRVSHVSDISRNDALVSTLIAGPANFLWDYARRETADQLQKEWEMKVLPEISGANGTDAVSILVGQDGPAMRFLHDQAAPFIQWKPGRNYAPKEIFGTSIPFSGSLFSFVNQGSKVSTLSKVSNVTVVVTAIAPEINPGAQRIPHLIRVELVCADRTQVLANRRQRAIEKSFESVQHAFTWSSACTDTTLQIDVGDSRLIKRYPGTYGFFAFLEDFKDGRHVFRDRDFPEEAMALRAMGIEFIDLHYAFKGAPNFRAPATVPTRIALAWAP